MFTCGSSENMKPHKCLSFEKVEFESCKSNACKHCQVSSADDDRKLCLQCYKNMKLLGRPEKQTIDKPTMMKEINDECYGGGCTFISDFPLDELQAMHREIVIEGNLSETFEKLNIL